MVVICFAGLFYANWWNIEQINHGTFPFSLYFKWSNCCSLFFFLLIFTYTVLFCVCISIFSFWPGLEIIGLVWTLSVCMWYSCSEIYISKVLVLNLKLLQLREYIDDTEDYINIQVVIIRLKLLPCITIFFYFFFLSGVYTSFFAAWQPPKSANPGLLFFYLLHIRVILIIHFFLF